MPIIIDRIVNDFKNRYNTATTTISKEMILNYSIIIFIFALAYLVRIFAVIRPYEIILSANDPYAQYRAAVYIEEHGLANFLSWIDDQTWYPEGRFWGKTLYIGTPLSAVLLHQLVSFLGLDIPLRVICYYQPALLGSITCILIYFLGKELGNRKIGLLAAFFLAISAGHLQRTVVGFYDNEALGILFLVLVLYFYARSLRTGSSTSAILSGICLGILAGSWGASTYVINLLALHAFVLIITKHHSDRLFVSYGGSIIVGFFIMTLIPRNGPASLFTTDALIPIAILLILLILEIHRHINTFQDTSKFNDRFRTFLPFIGIFIVLGIIILFLTGFLMNISAKFITVLLPIFRDDSPILKSVSEHQIVVWSTFFRNIGFLIFLIPISIYYLYEKPTEKNLLLLLFGITAIYFAGSMVRLALILAPAVSLLGAKAVDSTLLPFILTFQERFALSRRKTRFTQPLSNEHTVIAFAFIGIFLLLSVVMAVDNAVKGTYPPSILTPVYTGQQAIIGNDWQEAIAWLDYHTGNTDVVASWWDYGYWISGNSNTTILVDNATQNSTKIGNVGCLLVMNPRESLKIAKMYDVTYIVLLVSDGWYQFDSDLGKVPWFVRIGEKDGNIIQIDQDDYLEYDDRGQYIQGYVNKFYESVFWSLFTAEVSEEAYGRISSYSPITKNAPTEKGFHKDYLEYRDYYELSYKTTHNWIYIWRIKWDNIPIGDIAP